MNQLTDPLAALPPLVLPAAPGLWPLAPGWWILIALLLFLAFLLWRSITRRAQRLRWKKTALSELDELYDHAREGRLSGPQFAVSCSRLLRRFCCQQYRHVALEGLSGERWRQALNQCAAPAELTPDVLAALEQQYLREQQAVDPDWLFRELQRWFEQAACSGQEKDIKGAAK